jgi:hypothetical protein
LTSAGTTVVGSSAGITSQSIVIGASDEPSLAVLSCGADDAAGASAHKHSIHSNDHQIPSSITVQSISNAEAFVSLQINVNIHDKFKNSITL